MEGIGPEERLGRRLGILSPLARRLMRSFWLGRIGVGGLGGGVGGGLGVIVTWPSVTAMVITSGAAFSTFPAIIFEAVKVNLYGLCLAAPGFAEKARNKLLPPELVRVPDALTNSLVGLKLESNSLGSGLPEA